jgi:hypothetical protein
VDSTRRRNSMIKIKNTFNNGLFECEEIYSDIGMKILEKTNGQFWNTNEDNPITIAQKRHNDYEESIEPIDPFEEVETEIEKEEEVVYDEPSM